MTAEVSDRLYSKGLRDREKRLKQSDAFNAYPRPPTQWTCVRCGHIEERGYGALYSRVGNDLPTLNGNRQWALPIPATYVIDAEGRVVLAHVEADHRQRAEPQQVLALLRSPGLSTHNQGH